VVLTLLVAVVTRWLFKSQQSSSSAKCRWRFIPVFETHCVHWTPWDSFDWILPHNHDLEIRVRGHSMHWKWYHRIILLTIVKSIWQRWLKTHRLLWDVSLAVWDLVRYLILKWQVPFYAF